MAAAARKVKKKEYHVTPEGEIEKLSGKVGKFRYRSDSGWAVVGFLNEKGGYITCVGDFSGTREGDELDCYGRYCVHEKYGQEFRMVRCAPAEPKDMSDRDGVVEYFVRYVKGVGKATAEKIWDAFGSDSIEMIKEGSSELAKIVGEKKAQKIHAQVAESAAAEDGAFLDGKICARFGVGPARAAKIREKFGDTAIEDLEQNPYRVTTIDGFGFQLAEHIAESVGVPKDSPMRIRAGIRYAIMKAEDEGHTRLPHTEMVARSMKLLDTPGLTENDIYKQYQYLVDKRRLLNYGDLGTGWACIPYMAKAEGDIAESLIRLSGERDVDRAMVRRCLDEAYAEGGVRLSAQQEEAVLTALSNGVAVITGGPGTGKTTVINEVIRCFEAEDVKVLLCAPTGRAAKRMAEASGHEARTIHRALEFRPYADEEADENEGLMGKFNRNAANPFEQEAVIVDETSMVDVKLAASLLDAVREGGRILFVGDADQLPSVGPGSVFRDIITSGLFPVVRLSAVYRQDEKSSIIKNSVLINRGEVPMVTNDPQGDFFCYAAGDDYEAAELVRQIVSGGCPKLGLKAEDIQVLCPMRKGEAGVNALNEMLRRELNPEAKGKPETVRNGKIFRVGDRVMQVKNNYKMEWTDKSGFTDFGVFNGDTGMVSEISPEEADKHAQSIAVEFDDGRRAIYEGNAMDELEPAWAITIHKSQGSEYPAVVIPLLWGPPSLMTRGLLYTAVTRAKKYVFIVGKGSTFCAMVKNGFERKRYTGLLGMLRNEDYFWQRRQEQEQEAEAEEEAKRRKASEKARLTAARKGRRKKDTEGQLALDLDA